MGFVALENPNAVFQLLWMFFPESSKWFFELIVCLRTLCDSDTDQNLGLLTSILKALFTDLGCLSVLLLGVPVSSFLLAVSTQAVTVGKLPICFWQLSTYCLGFPKEYGCCFSYTANDAFPFLHPCTFLYYLPCRPMWYQARGKSSVARRYLLFQWTRVQFPASTSGGSQPPLTPVHTHTVRLIINQWPSFSLWGIERMFWGFWKHYISCMNLFVSWNHLPEHTEFWKGSSCKLWAQLRHFTKV